MDDCQLVHGANWTDPPSDEHAAPLLQRINPLESRTDGSSGKASEPGDEAEDLALRVTRRSASSVPLRP
jgi:hypothetical protein